MNRSQFARTVLAVLVFFAGSRSVVAQNIFPFTSGPIPLCDTSTFTASVSGVGWLIFPNGWDWGPYLESVMIDITTDHPQTLEISLTSPAGTTVLLSAFNGAGGQNYTNTNFSQFGWTPITSGTAPFTGDYLTQEGSLGDFAGENADGVWTITVVDTACANGGTGPGGEWTPGWFNGGVGTGAFAFGFASPPPPCIIDMGWQITVLCAGGTVDILSYYETNWGNGMGLVFTVHDAWTGTMVADPYAISTAGSYNVEAADMMGCWYYGTYEVQVAPVISIGPDQLVEQCSGADPVDLSTFFDLTGVAATSWMLDGVPIPTTAATAATTPGVYALSATNQGCNDMAQVTLAIGTGPVLGADQTVSICPGASVDLTILYTTTGYTAEWSYGGVLYPTPTMVVDPGIYTLLATTPDGCTDMAAVTLTASASLSLGADQAHDVCNNSSLDLTSLYTTTGCTVAWTHNGAPVMTPGTVYQGGTFQLVATTNGGCTDTARVVVTVEPSPGLGPDLIDNTCADVAADLTVFFATTGLTTSWTFGGVTVPSPTVVFDAGPYMLVAMNASGCADTAFTEIVVDPVPLLDPDQIITACTGVAVDLTTLYSTGIHGTAWTESGVPVADPTSASGAGIYTVTVTSAAQCAATAVVTLVLEPAPTLGPDAPASICDGSTFDLLSVYSTTGLATAWAVDGVPVADPASVAVSGNYQLVVTNGAGCTDTALVALTVDPDPFFGVDLAFSLCPWQTVDLSVVFATTGTTAVYALNDQQINDPTSVSGPGTYSVTLTDANGCTDEATATVTPVECLCEADFIHDASCIQDPARFTLLADSTVLSASWDFDGAAATSMAMDPMVIISSEGDVIVTLQATLSCGVVEVQRTVRMQDCSDRCAVWIPSAFTPDNDARNDTWAWYGECEPEDFNVAVYDRWGEIIFASNDPSTSWDGKYNGALSPSGVYAYRVGYRLPYQKRTEVAGAITLVR